MEKCPSCKTKFARRPILKDKDVGWKKGNINWWNFLFPPFEWGLVIIGVALIMYGFNAAVIDCQDAIHDPCKFCNTTGCCEYQQLPELYSIENNPFNPECG